MSLCPLCQPTPTAKPDAHLLDGLVLVARKGHYTRPDGNWTDFDLYRCPECGACFESARHRVEDPESTMGMGRDESEWGEVVRLPLALVRKRLDQLLCACTPDGPAVKALERELAP